MLPIVTLVLAASLNGAVPAPAPRQAPAAPSATATPAPGATAEAAPATPLSASDLDALRAVVGKEVEITGTPTGTGHSKSGNVFYLNFAGAHKAVALVFFAPSGAAAAAAEGAPKKAQSEEDIKPFVGKTINVKGKLSDYKGDLQIVVNSLDQITVAPTP